MRAIPDESNAGAWLRMVVRGWIGWLAMGATVMATGPATASDVNLLFRPVALTGDAAPGTDDAAYFDSFITFVSPSNLPPRIDADGTVAFFAFVAGGLVDAGNRSGIWSDGGGVLDLVARSGMQAPGVEPGVIFSGVPNEYLPFAPSYAAGRVAFHGTLTAPDVDITIDEGIWTGTSGNLELVVREGMQVPGLPDGAYFSSTNVLGIDTSGTVHIGALLFGTGVTGGSNESLLQYRDGELTMILREGDPAPGLGSGVFIGSGGSGIAYVFRGVSFNDSSQIVVSTLLYGSGVTSSNDEAVYLQDATSGEFMLLLREGDPVPGPTPGVRFGGNDNVLGLRAEVNNSAEVAFSTQVGGAVSTQTAVFRYADGGINVVAMSGDPAPGMGTEFSFTRFPALNDSGGIAFVAGLFFAPQGIWRSRDGELIDVVLPGTVVTRGGQSFMIQAINGISGFNVNDDTIARVTLEDDTGVLRSGLLMADTDGELAVLVAQGDFFDVHGDGSELRQVSRLVAGGFNDSGELAFRLDFLGGSSGHFVVARDGDGDDIADGRDNCATTVNPDQRDTDDDGFGNRCDADLNNDGIVNFEDLFLLQLVFLSTDEDADFNGDGVVNFLDLNIFGGLFLAPPG